MSLLVFILRTMLQGEEVSCIRLRCIYLINCFLIFIVTVATLGIHHASHPYAQYLDLQYHTGAGIDDANAIVTGHPNTFMVKNISQVLPSKISDVIFADCAALRELIVSLGIPAIFVVLPVTSWHQTSQLIGEILRYHPTKIPETIEVLNEFAWSQVLYKHNFQASGIVHGAIWYLTAKTSDWHDIMLIMNSVATFPVNALHAIGHGMLYREAPHFDGCSDPALTNSTAGIMVPLDNCLKAPLRYLAFGCTQGLFHALHEAPAINKEWWGKINSKDFLYPCSQVRASAWCFYWLTARASVLQVSDTGVHRWLRSASAHITWACTHYVNMSEVNIRGCIWGMSASLFPLFDHGIARNSSRSMGCLSSESSLTVVPRRTQLYCPQLFRNVHILGSKSTVVEWCSIVVEPRLQQNMSDHMWQRWLACLEGSRFFYEREVSCEHDLPWQIGERWFAMQLFCQQQQPFDYVNLWKVRSKSPLNALLQDLWD